jgi:hypothetical protein
MRRREFIDFFGSAAAQRGRSRRHTVAFIDHWRAGESCHFFSRRF